MNLTAELSEVKNFINGQFVPITPDSYRDGRNGQKAMDVISPIDGSIISTLPLSTYDDVDKAVQAAKSAFPSWSAMTLKDRVQIFFRYRTLLEKHNDELTKLIQLENGKTYGEDYYSFVNGQHTTQGGTHQNAFREAIVKTVRDFFGKNYEPSDIRKSIVSAISIKVMEPIFESQKPDVLRFQDLDPQKYVK